MEEARIRRLVPHGALADFVDCLWSQEGYGGTHPRERVLPTATTDLIFSSHQERGTASTIAGPRLNCIILDTSKSFSACGVHFKPGGARPFVAVPADELCNRVVSVDLLWGRFASSVEERLWGARTPDERLRILQAVLQERVSLARALHPAVAYAITTIDRSHGSRPIADIAAGIGLSTRRFLDLFRTEVGLSPKAFSKMRRFARVLATIDRTPHLDWTDVALSCGYFDQAHFNHDFRAFSGVSPSEYLHTRASRTHLVVASPPRSFSSSSGPAAEAQWFLRRESQSSTHGLLDR